MEVTVVIIVAVEVVVAAIVVEIVNLHELFLKKTENLSQTYFEN